MRKHAVGVWTGMATMAMVVAGLTVSRPVAAEPDPVPPGCNAHLCVVGGEIAFNHPTWGPTRLIVAYNQTIPVCRFTAIDAAGTTRWEYEAAGCDFGAHPISPVADAAGNMFVKYSTPRYEGVTVLHPTVDGLDDFGSLPDTEGGMPTAMRFYLSSVYDVDSDGALEIIDEIRTCEPDCATGPSYYRTYSWDGTDFFADLCTEPQRPGVPIQATAGPGGTVLATIPAGTCGVTSNITDWSTESGWSAVWYDGVSGWAPADSFALPPVDPPWPGAINPIDPQESITVLPAPTAPPTTAPPAPASGPVCPDYRYNDRYPIRLCDEGIAVYEIQWDLEYLGYDVDVDNYFGPGTERAVRKFQANNGLEVDGLVGPDTWRRLTTGLSIGWDQDGSGVIDPWELDYSLGD